MRLEALEEPLTAALEQLLETPGELRPFVCVDDTITKCFVQFCTRCTASLGAPLLFDDPTRGVQLGVWSAEEGAKLAAAVLATAYELPPFADLTITFDTQPNARRS